VNTLLASWKSTLAGVLSFLTTTGVVLLATGNSVFSPKVTTWMTIGLALARAYMGLIQKDADKVTTTDVAKATALATKP
jgi:hypothetical protein